MLVPLLVTAYTVLWLFDLVSSVPLVGRLAPRIPVLGGLDPAVARAILTVGILLAALVLVSWAMRTAVGAYFESRLDATVNQVPGFRVVYNASKIAMETTVSDDVEVQSPAKLEVWDGARLTAFRTGREAGDGRTTVFVPASPVIFTGLLIEVDDDRVSDTTESAEDALIRVISAGFAERGDTSGTAPATADTPSELATVGHAMRDDGDAGENARGGDDADEGGGASGVDDAHGSDSASGAENAD